MNLIILAGGSGTRLFPLSRSCFPKQFLKIGGKHSLLQQTLLRFNALPKANIVIITNKAYYYHVLRDLEELGISDAHILTEPEGKNTAPAIALGLAYCRDVLQSAREESVFVTPADHIITPNERFTDYVRQAERLAADGRSIVTLGIKPTRPETGYGYILAGEAVAEAGCVVQAFKEKPDLATAKLYCESGKYFWNAGMFCFTINAMEQALASYQQDIWELYQLGYQECLERFSAMPSISIDYAVAEKSSAMRVLPLKDIYWNDVGSFDSLTETLDVGEENITQGDVVSVASANNMILASDRLVSTVGVKNLIVVDTPDVLMISERGKSQDVKLIVERLKQEQRKEVDENVTMYRPWGSYTVLSEGDGFKVKRITVNPGAKLSLQMHYHRSEHWTVISGTGRLTLDDKVVVFKENESTYIPIAVKHRLENPGKIPLSIIEVQNGRYLGEDDIVRFDDVYGR